MIMNSMNRFDIPEIAKGTVIPSSVERFIEAEERARKAERKAKLYFWAGVVTNIICMFVGYLLGKFL